MFSLFPIVQDSFNSSQVGWEHLNTYYQNKSHEVSIPHRQAGNDFFCRKLYELQKVSIPHRQAGNIDRVEDKKMREIGFNSSQVGWELVPCCRLPATILQFQFLIGRLGTQIGQSFTSDAGMFQFLIGRLGTVSLFPDLDREEGFQFLIGRLGTLIPGQASAAINRFNSSQVGWEPV